MRIMTTSLARIDRCASIAMMLSLAFVGATGCADTSHITATDGPPIAAPAFAAGEMRATVDVAAGTMTFEPLASRAVSGGAGIISRSVGATHDHRYAEAAGYLSGRFQST